MNDQNTSTTAPIVGLPTTSTPPAGSTTTTSPTTSGTSATAPITSASTAPTPPVVVPSSTAGTSTTSAFNNTTSASQQALLTLTGGKTSDALNNYNTSASNETGLINEYLGEGADQAAQEKAAGTPQLQAAAASLNTQYLTTQETYNNQYAAILNDSSMSTDEQARAVESLQQKNGLALSNVGIQAALASNNYTNAETIIQHSIQLKYAPLQDAIQYGMNFVNNNKDLLTTAETNQFNAQIGVQQQTYTQGTFYSQLNATTNLSMIQDATANKAPADVINSMQSLIASGADAGQVAAAGGQYLSKGNYSYQFNPSTGQFSLINSNTGLAADGTPAGSSPVTYDPTDPSSATTVNAPGGGQYDFSTYATDPQYGLKINAGVSTIVSKVGQITSPALMQAAISTLAPNSTLNGADAYSAAMSADMDPTVFAAQLQQESLCGSSSVASQDNNFTGVTYTGSPAQLGAGITQGSARPASEGGYYAKFATPQDGLNYGAKVSAGDYKNPPAANAPGQTPTIQSKIQAITQVKSQLPANISGAVSYINSTGDGYIDMSKVQDLPGFPAGSGAAQALSYAKALGLTPLNADQVSAIQDYDTAMQKVNTLQDQWNAVAPGGVLGRAGADATDPFSMALDTKTGQALVAYNSNAAAALSTFNSITGSKRLSSFSTDLSEAALPTTPRLGWFDTGSNGDTTADGNKKLDNLRNDLNDSLKSIIPSTSGAPLSSDLSSTPLPTAGTEMTVGTGAAAITYKYNADGSATVVSVGASQ